MSDETMSKHDHVLLGLVMTLQFAAMQQLGKLANPLTGQVERDLASARATIDLLEMLKVKCRTGTPASLLQTLDTAVLELQMNYLDEVRKDQAAPPPAAETPTAETPADAGEGATA